MWSRGGGMSLPLGTRDHNGFLTITNAVPQDSGVYVCTATTYQNVQVSSNARVTIIQRDYPGVRVQPDRQTIPQGTVGEVRCLSHGEQMQVRWTKYGESSLGANARQVGDTLKIVNAQISDRGVYICHATSSKSTYEASAIVEVEREFTV